MTGGRIVKPLRRPWLWLGLWISAIVAVIALSLVPPPELPLDLPSGVDKVEHFVAYCLLSAAAVQLFASRRALLWIGLAMVGLGVGLEFAQHLATTTRTMDQADAWADLLGVAVGFATRFAPFHDLLLRREPWRR